MLSAVTAETTVVQPVQAGAVFVFPLACASRCATLQRKERGVGSGYPRLMEPTTTFSLDLFLSSILATGCWSCSRLHGVGSSGHVGGLSRQLKYYVGGPVW